jgi:hypothetical protein
MYQIKYLERIDQSTFDRYYKIASEMDFQKILYTRHKIYDLIGQTTN